MASLLWAFTFSHALDAAGKEIVPDPDVLEDQMVIM